MESRMKRSGVDELLLDMDPLPLFFQGLTVKEAKPLGLFDEKGRLQTALSNPDHTPTTVLQRPCLK